MRCECTALPNHQKKSRLPSLSVSLLCCSGSRQPPAFLTPSTGSSHLKGLTRGSHSRVSLEVSLEEPAVKGPSLPASPSTSATSSATSSASCRRRNPSPSATTSARRCRGRCRRSCLRGWHMRCCSCSKVHQARRPNRLQGLAIVEDLIALQAPRQHHLGAMLRRHLMSQDGLGMLGLPQGVHVHLRGQRIQDGLVSLDDHILVVSFHEELGGCCRPLRIWGQGEPAGLDDLGDREKLRLHGEGVSLHPSHEVPRGLLEEGDGQFAAEGLALVAPILLPCEGLVLRYIEDHGRLEGQLEHEALLEHRLQVVPPSRLEGRSCCTMMRARMLKRFCEEPCILWGQVEAIPVEELRPMQRFRTSHMT